VIKYLIAYFLTLTAVTLSMFVILSMFVVLSMFIILSMFFILSMSVTVFYLSNKIYV